MILQIPSDTLGISIIMFLFSILLTIATTLFYMNWGDKIQLIKKRALFYSLSIIPGCIIEIIAFFLLYDNFADQFLSVLINVFLSSVIPVFIIKHISFRTIKYQEIRELTELEKGKILLQIKNLKVYYPLLGGFLKRQIGAVKAVDGVSLTIKTGETLGLVGESGCGKTTLAKAILGLEEAEEGEMLFHDIKIDEKFSSYLRQKIQIVFQDPDASLNPRLKVIDIIGEPLKNLLGITKKTELRKYVLRLLEEVSLKREHLDRYPDEFSGGQKQRIVIARALACNPELIILDEPTSALDVSVQAQIINLLQRLQRDYGYGFLFITHNLSVVQYIADQIAVMYLGRIVELGSKNQLFSKPTHPYTQALLNSRIKIDPNSQDIKYVIGGEVPSPIRPPPGCHFNPRCSSDSRTKECEFEIPHMMEVEDNHYIWCVNPPTGVDLLSETKHIDEEVGEVPFGNPKKRFRIRKKT
jgi:oligopeptide/dipeptide ABC transporter ATP-binding protein